jgi:hypothetical protein
MQDWDVYLYGASDPNQQNAICFKIRTYLAYAQTLFRPGVAFV